MQDLAHWLFLRFMDKDPIEPAIQRIEAALARIAAVADAPPAAAAGPGQAETADTALRETVSLALAELDDLIGKLEG